MSAHDWSCSEKALLSRPELWPALRNWFCLKKKINFLFGVQGNFCLHFVSVSFPLSQTPAGFCIDMLVTGVYQTHSPLPDPRSSSCCSPFQKSGCKPPPCSMSPRRKLIRKCTWACSYHSKQGPSSFPLLRSFELYTTTFIRTLWLVAHRLGHILWKYTDTQSKNNNNNKLIYKSKKLPYRVEGTLSLQVPTCYLWYNTITLQIWW